MKRFGKPEIIVFVIGLLSLSWVAVSLASGNHRRPETSAGEASGVQLYQTLAGKMARMEELLNRIDRFIGFEDMQEAIVQDAQEFVDLTLACQNLFPPELVKDDQAPYNAALTKTAELGDELRFHLKKQQWAEAQEVFGKLDAIRRKSHSQFSY